MKSVTVYNIKVNDLGGLKGGWTGAVVRASDYGPMGSLVRAPAGGAVRCGPEQVTFTPCSVLVKPRKRWT